MKLLHTSDWHLGRFFHNVSLLDDQRIVLAQIIAYAVEHKVDGVLIAGDVFDRAIPPAPAIALLDEVLHELTQVHQIPVILISGNHDSAERLAFGARQLANQNLHIVHSLEDSNQSITLTTEGKNGEKEAAAIYGVPYHTPEAVKALFDEPVKTFDSAHTLLVNRILGAPSTADFNILLSHCFVDGAEACDSERPLAIGGIDRVSASPMATFDYVALGHLHGQQKRGYEHIRYSGSPMQYSFSEERHNKSATLVTLSHNQPAEITLLPLTPLRGMRAISGTLESLIEQAPDDPQRDDFLAITLTDKHAILDAMSKLRVHYPNVLQLEKEYLQINTQTDKKNNAAARQKDEKAMFGDFFREVTGESLSSTQKKYMQTLLNDLHQHAPEETQ